MIKDPAGQFFGFYWHLWLEVTQYIGILRNSMLAENILELLNVANRFPMSLIFAGQLDLI